MSATQTPTENEQSHSLHCTRCNAVLPQYAVFCGQCGQRVKNQGAATTSPLYGDIVERYRITSLVRRRPYTQLFFALDNQLQQTVAINAVNINALDETRRAEAIEAFQNQHDLLRRLNLPTLMRLTDLHYFEGYLYVVANYLRKEEADQLTRPHQLSTLFGLLQSGIGLPGEQMTIAWAYRLSRTLEVLHQNHLIPGDIDPDTVLFHKASFAADPILMVSWLPARLSAMLPQSSIDTNTAYFYAPETLIGESEPCSDIYSLGAILYLLLSGVTPKSAAERAREPLAPLRELNSRISSAIESVVMRALALEKRERYQSAAELSEALLRLSSHPHKLSSPLQLLPLTTQPGEVSPEQSREPQDRRDDHDHREEIHISSPPADNTNDEATEDASSTVADEDATISAVPLQARMARRYLSKIKNSKIEAAGERNGEKPVEDALTEIREAEAQGNEAEGAATAEIVPAASSDGVREDLASLPTSSLVPEATTGRDASTLTGEEAPGPEESTALEEVTIKIGKKEQQIISQALDDIQHQPTLAHSALEGQKREPTQATAAEEEDRGGIEQLATIPFTYEEAGNVHQQIKEQEEQDQQEKETSRALQVYTPKPLVVSRDAISEALKNLFTKTTAGLPALLRPRELNIANPVLAKQLAALKANVLLRQVQHFLLGEPQNSTKAAALIEAPLRIQPNQSYSIRINVIGREKARDAQAAGLSALTRGEKVHIELRSALYQNYAYIVQQADIEIPGEGYVAEVTMPMQTLGGPSGRRERLHIFFMDETNSPLYEKPFVLELFISHLVQSGREGHNVLSIPL